MMWRSLRHNCEDCEEGEARYLGYKTQNKVDVVVQHELCGPTRSRRVVTRRVESTVNAMN
jgi:hypothetical protein